MSKQELIVEIKRISTSEKYVNEEKFRLLTENSVDMIYRITLPEGNYEYVSPTSKIIFGYEPEVFYSSPILIQDLIHPDWRKYFKEEWEKLISGKMSPSYEYEIIHKDGSIKRLHQRNRLITDSEKNPIAIEGIVTDITDRKQADEKLILYKRIIEESKDAIAIIDSEGNYIEQNHTHRSLIGYSDEELKGNTPAIHLGEATFLKIANNLSRHGMFRGEMTSTTKTGEKYIDLSAFSVLNEFGDLICNVGIKRDITDRKLADENLFKMIKAVRNSHEVIFMTDKDGIITFVNPEFTKMYGYTAEEVIGEATPRILKSGNFTEEKYKQFWNALLSKQSIQAAQYVNKHKDGTLIDVEGSADPITNDFGEIIGFLGIQRDITERKQVENDLRDNEAMLSELLRNLPGMAYQCKNDEQWTMLFVNDGCKKLTGYTADQLINNKDISFNELIHPEDRDLVHRQVSKALNNKQYYELEYRIISEEGKEKWVWERGALSSIDDDGFKILNGVIQEISERVIAEKENKMLAFALNSTANTVVITDRDGNIEWANLAFSLLTGYSQEEALGQNPNILNSGKHDEEYYQNMWNIISNGQVWHGEITNKRKDGELYNEEMTITPLLSDGGKIEKFIAIKQDITQRKRFEDELQVYRENLELIVKDRTIELEVQTDKMRESQKAMRYLLEDVNNTSRDLEISNEKLANANKELESFSYSVSHDLRAPLRAVNGFSNKLSLLLGNNLSEEQARVLTVIQNNILKMGNLIDDLLNFSRMSRSQISISEIDMHSIASEIVKGFKEEISARNINLKIGNLIPALGDKKLIPQVLLNLLSNAIKFTKINEETIIEIGCREEADHIEYFVRDNGTGFDMKYIDKLFQVFQRLHSANEYEGTGIGLAIVNRIISRLGGKVWAESELDKGSTFFFTLKKRKYIDKSD